MGKKFDDFESGRMYSLENEISNYVKGESKKYYADLSVRVLNCVDSTMKYVSDRLEVDLTAPAVVVALKQTAGRGRLNRRWENVLKGLYGTFLFSCVDHENITCVPLIAGLSVIDALPRFKSNLRLKWPNDIVTTEGHKLGGILCEFLRKPSDNSYVSIGIGINIRGAPNIENTSSLYDLYSNVLDTTKLAAEIYVALSRNLETFFDQGFKPFKAAYERISYGLGNRITFHNGDRIIHGVYLGVTDEGNIMLVQEDGIVSYFSGEIARV